MIVRADASQLDQVSELVATAFHPLDATGWLVPDESEQHGRFKANFAIFIEHALEYGHVDVTDDGTAAAVWVHHDGEEDVPPPANFEERLAAVAGPYLQRFQALGEAFEANHPHGKPHHYLVFLAVHPDRQDVGVGSQLLEHHHAVLDKAGLGAYLEASSPRSRDLYQRHGYTVQGGQPFYLQPDGPPFWPMWREPQG